MSDTVKILQVIETTLSRRGNGTSDSPIRIVKEYWTMDGEKLFEKDPCVELSYPEDEIKSKKFS